MEEAVAARYWCHRCSQIVNPTMELEVKCPFCQSGFVEELGSETNDFTSDGALSLWAPILLGMMRNPRRRRRRSRRQELDEDVGNDLEDGELHQGDETELDRELESVIRRRRRNSATILQLVQSLRAGLTSDSENSGIDREREPVILINPFSQTVIVQGSYDSSQSQSQNQGPIGSLGDYFIGPGLDLLLQHLAENDPSRYGTPPAQKEAVEAMPTVKLKENLQCSVCLDDLNIGTEAREMPCKHIFHNGCILPWLELHSSCPVCRFQLPADESKLESRNSTTRGEGNNINDNSNGDGDGNAGGSGNENDAAGNEDSEDGGTSGNGRRISFRWPFNNVFTSAGSEPDNGNSSSN